MSGSGLLQYVALDRMDVVFATKEVRSRISVPRQSVTDRLLHGRRIGLGDVTKTIVNDSWGVDARGPLA